MMVDIDESSILPDALMWGFMHVFEGFVTKKGRNLASSIYERKEKKKKNRHWRIGTSAY